MVAWKLGFSYSLHGEDNNSYIWLMWKDDYSIALHSGMSQALTVVITTPTKEEFLASFVYASCSHSNRKELWKYLMHINDSCREAWIIGGDFNAILDVSEKQGGKPCDISLLHDFQNLMLHTGLLDAGFLGSKFTWCNNRLGAARVWKRLDRVLLNTEFQSAFPYIRTLHLERVCSDHSPLCLSFTVAPLHRKSPFIFQRMWTDHPSFHKVVSQSWTKTCHGPPGVILHRKLLRLQKVLKDWNWNTFGDLNKNIKNTQEQITHLENRLQINWENDVHEEWVNATKHLHRLEQWELEMLCSKARLDWAKEGDRNSKLYHATIKQRRRHQTIKVETADGIIATNPIEVARVATDFFANLFKASEYWLDDNLFDHIVPIVTGEVNEEFCALPTSEEIKAAVWDLNPASSPGDDGFTGYFYRNCWDIIQSDLVGFIIDFYRGGHIPAEIARTTLILLPKVEGAKTIGDYRPISLGNFSGKILSKIIASRLSKLLPSIIDEEQAGFVQGRTIATHVVLAQELMHNINRLGDGGNIVLKLDMAKAYDRLEWRFLLRAMRCFGFSHQACDLIYRTICNIGYRFRINGESVGNFRSYRGVRQGDPLSPMLFILAQQVLSINLKRRINNQTLVEYRVGRREMSISHLLYADDILLFTSGNLNSLSKLMDLFHSSELSSGQLINRSKSGVFLGKGAAQATDLIEQITGIRKKSTPLMYLGVPIVYGRNKAEYYEYLVSRVRKKIEGWKAKFLSFGGRITLIKAVLASTPIYTMACSKIPKSVLNRLEQLMAGFLWSSNGEARHHWINWTRICTPVEEGGLGLRSLVSVMECLHGKLMWMALQGGSLWARYARAKYFLNGHFLQGQTSSHIWRAMQPHYQILSGLSRWIVGKGEVSFWRDNWVGDILQGDHTRDVKLRVKDAIPHLHLYLPFISCELHDKLQQVVLHPHSEDRLIFTLTEHGRFSAKEYWEHLRDKGDEIRWARQIWSNLIPYNVGAFMWRLLYSAIPVDDRLKSKGIIIVSRCACCSQPQAESLEHLFLTSECAREVWNFFGAIFHVASNYSSVLQAINLWVPRITHQTQYEVTRTAVCMHIFREIWKARCSAVYGEEKMVAGKIIKHIKRHVNLISLMFTPKKKSTRAQTVILETLGCQVQQVVIKRPKWIRWEPPGEGRHKLNVDGSASNGACTGGGIIRDDNGVFVAGFSHFYGPGTNNHAELLAITDGLRLCHQLGIINVGIHSDSQIVINHIKAGHRLGWAEEYISRDLQRLHHSSFTYNHVYRQENKVADRLAHVAHEHQGKKEFYSFINLPSAAKEAYREDSLGIWQLRP